MNFGGSLVRNAVDLCVARSVVDIRDAKAVLGRRRNPAEKRCGEPSSVEVGRDDGMGGCSCNTLMTGEFRLVHTGFVHAPAESVAPERPTWQHFPQLMSWQLGGAKRRACGAWRSWPEVVGGSEQRARPATRGRLVKSSRGFWNV